MSERILKALMQLFAIVAKINVIEESDEIVAADSSKNIVEISLCEISPNHIQNKKLLNIL